MSESSKLTTITLSHGALSVVGHVLEEAGFTLGTVGGGEGTMERDGAISDAEAAELSAKMGEALFFFTIEDLEEGSGDAWDTPDYDDE